MAFSGSQTTRFSLMAMFTRLHGSFAGKESAAGPAPTPPGTLLMMGMGI